MVGRRLTAILALLAAGIVAGSIGMTADSARAGETLPDRVTATGTWTLDRRAHDACVAAVPSIIEAELTLTVDTVTGIVDGEIVQGSGSGSYDLPGSCLPPDAFDEVADDRRYVATSDFTGDINGTVSADGVITADVTMYLQFDGEYGYFPGMEGFEKARLYGGGFLCATSNVISFTCPLPEAVSPQTAQLTGTVAPDGALDLSLDWYTNDCVRITRTGETGIETSYSRDNCATSAPVVVGQSDVVGLPTPTTVASTQRPVIERLWADPAQPTDDDIVVLSVAAEDPDGDPLSYSWSIDGRIQGVDRPTVTWEQPPAGDHTIEVTVGDPSGETDVAAMTLRVTEGAGDRDGDGVLDDEDACPDQFGLGEDGCPPFAASISCVPPRPLPENDVTCTVDIAGARPTETLLVQWFLDGTGVQTAGLDGRRAHSWVWANAAKGDHVVRAEVLGEDRQTSASQAVEVTGGVVDESSAGFAIRNLACNSGITSDEILLCNLTVERVDEDIGALALRWLIDGQVAREETLPGSTSSWSLDRPAPGDHVVQAIALDPATNLAVTQLTPAVVRRGRSDPVPSLPQAMAGGATAATIGAWLWAESRRRDEARAAAIREVPSWVNDPRPLAQIWRDEGWSQATRRGLDASEWVFDSVTGAFVNRSIIEQYVDQAHQRDLRNQWHELTTTLEQNPKLTALSEFIRQNESNVWRGDRIDPKQMARLQRAVYRLGGLEAGFQQVREHTLGDTVQKTAIEFFENPIIRAIAATKTLGASEVVFQGFSSYHKMDRRIRVGGWSYKDASRAAHNEMILAAGTSLVMTTGIRGFGGVAVEGAKRVASAGGRVAGALSRVMPEVINRTARTVVRGVESLVAGAKAAIALGNMPVGQAVRQVKVAWNLSRQGVAGAWQQAADLVQREALRTFDPRLATLVDDVVQGLDDAAGAVREAPNLTFTAGRAGDLTDDAFRLTSTEQAAAKILRDSPQAYRRAVEQGLMPTRVHQVVNHTRDKVLKHAVLRAYRNVRQSVRAGLQRIEISGTGARPWSNRASSGWTDADFTAIGAQDAERGFAAEFYRQVRSGGNGMPGMHPRRIDCTMFAGARAGHGSSPGGFRSQALINWRNVDYQFSGRAITPTTNGNLLFGQHPDAALRSTLRTASDGTTFWGLENIADDAFLPRAAPGSAEAFAARADVARLIDLHNGSDPPPSALVDLTRNGKYATRLAKIERVGLGLDVPEGVGVLEYIKANKPTTLPASQLTPATRAYEWYTGRIAGGRP